MLAKPPSPTKPNAVRNDHNSAVTKQGLNRYVPIRPKRTDSVASSHEFSEAEEAPASAEANNHDIDLAAAQQAAIDRLRATWEGIFEKYSDKSMLEGDVVDLETGEIVENHGHLMSMSTTQSVWSDPKPVPKQNDNQANVQNGKDNSLDLKASQFARPKSVEPTPTSNSKNKTDNALNSDDRNANKNAKRGSLTEQNIYKTASTPQRPGQSPQASFATPKAGSARPRKQQLEEDAFDNLITPARKRKHNRPSSKKKTPKDRRSSLNRASQSPIRKIQYNVPFSPRHGQLMLDDDDDQLISPAASQVYQPLSPLDSNAGENDDSKVDETETHGEDLEVEVNQEEEVQYIEYFTVEEIEPLPIGKHEQIAEPDSAYRYNSRVIKEIANLSPRRVRTRSTVHSSFGDDEDEDGDVQMEHDSAPNDDLRDEELHNDDLRDDELHNDEMNDIESDNSQATISEMDENDNDNDERSNELDRELDQNEPLQNNNSDAQALVVEYEQEGMLDVELGDSKEVNHANSGSTVTGVREHDTEDEVETEKVNHDNAGSTVTGLTGVGGHDTEDEADTEEEEDEREDEGGDEGSDDDGDDDEVDSDEEEEDDFDEDESLVEITEQQFHKVTKRISEVLKHDHQVKFEDDETENAGIEPVTVEPTEKIVEDDETENPDIAPVTVEPTKKIVKDDMPFGFADKAAQDRHSFILELDSQTIRTATLGKQACGVQGYRCSRPFCFTCS